MAYLRCRQCGHLVDESYRICPDCGGSLKHVDKGRRSSAPVWCGILVFILVGGFFAKQHFDSKKYESNLATALNEIISAAAKVEEAGTLIHDVWKNAIFQTDDEQTNPFTRRANGTGDFYEDFNDALLVLYADKHFQGEISSIEDDLSTIAGLMKDLKNPPRKYEADYLQLRDLYTAFMELYSLVKNPTGSLAMYTEKFNAADEKVVSLFWPLSFYLSD